jgi:Uma2 family endonuclease
MLLTTRLFREFVMVTTRLYAADDLLAIANSAQDFELIEGELIPTAPTDYEQGSLQVRISSLVYDHARANDLGEVVTEAGFILGRNPDTVLAPDVAFVPIAKVPKQRADFAELAPDLVVESISLGNSPAEIERKLVIYLQAGVRAVWIVYPRARQVVAHGPDLPPKRCGESDSVDGGDVLPGLSIPVAEICS